MNIYEGLIVALFIAGLLFGGSSKKKRETFTLVACILLYIVCGLRDVTTIGNDSATSYYGEFLYIGTGDISLLGRNGLFFNLLQIGNRLTGGDYQLFMIAYYAFIYYSLYRFVKKYSPYPFVSIFWFIFMFYAKYFDILKQCLAMTILLYAFDAVMEEKPIKFVLLVLLAAGFHVPALVFMPAYLLPKLKIGKSYLIQIVVGLTVVYVFRTQILDLMLSIYGSDVDSSEEDVLFWGTKPLIMFLILIFAYFFRPPDKKDKLYSTLFGFMGAAMIFQTYCYYNNTFERLADYYYQFSVVFMPLIFTEREKRKKLFNRQVFSLIRALAFTVIALFSSWNFISLMNASTLYLPYRFFWQA